MFETSLIHSNRGLKYTIEEYKLVLSGFSLPGALLISSIDKTHTAFKNVADMQRDYKTIKDPYLGNVRKELIQHWNEADLNRDIFAHIPNEQIKDAFQILEDNGVIKVLHQDGEQGDDWEVKFIFDPSFCNDFIQNY